jgi:hypothetical protein
MKRHKLEGTIADLDTRHAVLDKTHADKAGRRSSQLAERNRRRPNVVTATGLAAQDGAPPEATGGFEFRPSIGTGTW